MPERQRSAQPERPSSAGDALLELGVLHAAGPRQEPEQLVPRPVHATKVDVVAAESGTERLPRQELTGISNGSVGVATGVPFSMCAKHAPRSE